MATRPIKMSRDRYAARVDEQLARIDALHQQLDELKMVEPILVTATVLRAEAAVLDALLSLARVADIYESLEPRLCAYVFSDGTPCDLEVGHNLPHHADARGVL